MQTNQVLNLSEKIHGDVIIGFFDVIHRGHLKLLENNHSASIITFTSIPHKTDALNSLTVRIANLQKFGFSKIYVLQPAQMDLTAATFVDQYLSEANHIIVGSDFKFGSDFKSILDFKGLLKIEVKDYDSQYSTTKIKNLLAQGNITAVNSMLTEDFRITHIVEHGNKFGRTLGFPTINFNYPNQSFLASGIYHTSCIVNDKLYKSVTVSNKAKVTGNEVFDVIETYILNFTGNLYNQAITVIFHEKIGDLKNFNSIEALKTHILKYVDIVKSLK